MDQSKVLVKPSVELLSDLQVPEELMVLTDPHRLDQALTNILSNAAKFTERGQIIVSVHLEQSEDPNRRRLLFSIKDTGIGMDEATQKTLFRPFTQADSSTTRLYGGTGLGLAITRQIIESMGGMIIVRSALGEGSEFAWFAVPPFPP